jgi:CRISPR-associated protein Cas1
MLSFVYDVADLYKTDLTIPMAFRTAAEKPPNLETRVRYACRESFHNGRLLQRIVQDLDRALAFEEATDDEPFAEDEARPGGLWDPQEGQVAGGRNQEDE